jgi:hypothetical protein
VAADPILIELHSLTINRARAIIKRKGWKASYVRCNSEPRLIQRDERFAVQNGDVEASFYFDENPIRRATTSTMSPRRDKATAFADAQKYLASKTASPAKT